jgi:hypothetical protein
MFHINLEGLSDDARSLYVSIARDVSNSLAYREYSMKLNLQSTIADRVPMSPRSLTGNWYEPVIA